MNQARILLIDDEPLLLRTLTDELEEAGWRVTPCASGPQALRRLKEGLYDLVITDLKLDQINGLEILETARRLERQALVIILTAYGSLDSAVQALRLGAADYLLKPYEAADLQQRVQTCLEQRALRRRLELGSHRIPLCPKCGKIGEQVGLCSDVTWSPVATFLRRHAGAEVEPLLCPACGAESGCDRA
ncbi:MAG: response regulator [Candidatus Marinimicrobia bacterium]|nr:response regulator [Candidatus Neomarinimicrobiota bacterium]